MNKISFIDINEILRENILSVLKPVSIDIDNHIFRNLCRKRRNNIGREILYQIYEDSDKIYDTR